MSMDYSDYHRDKDYGKFEKMFRNIFSKRLALINSLMHIERGKVLDIGCSTGVFLDLFKEREWETWGVEPSKSAEIARKKGHKIIRGYFEKTELPENYFDIVVMNHTLEHMDDPVGVLRKASMLLKKGGKVFVDVPNAGGLGAKFLGMRWPYRLPEEHKFQFTKDSLSSVFKDAGFKPIHWESRSGIFEYANPFLEIFESLLDLKKRLFTNIFTLPFAILATSLNMGDSMSMIGTKK